MLEKNDLSFEQQLQKVQEIISLIEKQDLPLEESVARFEEGMRILNVLECDLQKIERKLTVLREGKEGETVEVPMEIKE